MSQVFDPLMFSLITARLRAYGASLEFPKDVSDEVLPLLDEAENNLRKARDLYSRVNEIQKANEARRLPVPERAS